MKMATDMSLQWMTGMIIISDHSGFKNDDALGQLLPDIILLLRGTLSPRSNCVNTLHGMDVPTNKLLLNRVVGLF
jgi:hypothetical protein